MELKSNLSFNNLSFKFPLHEFKGIPLNFDISRVFYKSDEILDIEVFEESSIKYESEKIIEINRITSNFNFIDTEAKLYKNFTMNYLEYKKIESINDIIYTFDELDLIELNRYIEKYKILLQREYMRRLNVLFRLTQKKPDIKLDKEYPKAPDDVNEFTLRDRTFMLAQLSIEYNPTPIFPENKDKTMHEWSFREVEFHLAYITCKTRIESTENRYQAHMQEKMYKENSGDS